MTEQPLLQSLVAIVGDAEGGAVGRDGAAVGAAVGALDTTMKEKKKVQNSIETQEINGYKINC